MTGKTAAGFSGACVCTYYGGIIIIGGGVGFAVIIIIIMLVLDRSPKMELSCVKYRVGRW